MVRQLRFDLPSHVSLGREDFFVSPSNAEALSMIDAWPFWPGSKLLITGPSGSGKTHLARIWAARSGARVLHPGEMAPTTLVTTPVEELARGPICVEDAQRVAGSAEAETWLFHLHNLVLAEGHTLLLTADAPAARWGLRLPDLDSRMQGTASAALRAPDDALFGAILTKLFADRQISVASDVVPYLLRHAPRRFSDAAQIVRLMDDMAMSQGRPMNRYLARCALDALRDDRECDGAHKRE